MIEAHLINTPYRVGNDLHFSVVPNLPKFDMASICRRCGLSDWCFGSIYLSCKDARINLRALGIKKITSTDVSNCGIIPDLMANKEEVQWGFFPRPGYSPAK